MTLARCLIIGCGCRGLALAGALSHRGHAVRATTRDSGRLLALEPAGELKARYDADTLEQAFFTATGSALLGETEEVAA